MSRVSQNQFKHRIDRESAAENTVRFSLTLRCTHWHYFNSTFFDGDSNFGKLQLGEGRGKIGAATPGTRGWSPKIEDIDPARYQSYSNVILMVGTNNLKEQSVSSYDDVLNLYKIYKSKILEIQKLSPMCNIFVCPVLPSKLHDLNRKIGMFNRFLFEDLARSTFGVTIVDGFLQFCGPDGRLNENLSNPGDALHIDNKGGIQLLVILIKRSMYLRKNSVGKISSSRSFSDALRSGTAHQP